MAGKDVTVRAQALDGIWQTIGSESARGVYPEGVTLEADQWGSLAASFNLRRDPTAFWPDITAFTPIEVDVASRLVWSGRLKDTPSQVAQRLMNVQCEGWQFHLDDDVYKIAYVHTDLTAWKDQRSFPNANLIVFRTTPQVQAGNGVITIVWPSGSAVATGEGGGVTLDLGPGTLWDRIVVEWERVGSADAGWTVTARGTDNDDLATGPGPSDPWAVNLGTASATSPGTFSSTKRHVHVFVYRNGSPTTVGGDIGVRIKSIKLFANAAWESGNESNLKASDVVRDALPRSTVLLSGDMSGIADTSFNISSYVPDWKTPRQAWSAVDAYHDWMKQITVDRRPIYQPKPTRPLYEVGVWSAINDDDASANSGAEIYNRAVGVAQAPDGSPVIADGVPSDPVLDYTGIGQIPNPSAAINASGWTAVTGAMARDTSSYDSAPASLKATGSSGSMSINASAAAAINPLRRFRLSFAYWIQKNPFVSNPQIGTAAVTLTTTPSNRTYRLPLTWGFAGVWLPGIIDFIQPANVTDTGYTISLDGSSLDPTYFALSIDSFDVARIVTTLVDRRGFTRAMQIPVGSTLPDDGIALQAIGGVWLNAHKTTPFRGTITLVGDESLRDILTGAPVPLETLLTSVGQLIRFSDRSDPDTAGHARDGRIAHVSYTPATNTAVVTIDNSRTSFDALLARNAVVQGG